MDATFPIPEHHEHALPFRKTGQLAQHHTSPPHTDMRPDQVLASTYLFQHHPPPEAGEGKGSWKRRCCPNSGSLPSLTATHCTPGTTRLCPGASGNERLHIQSLTLSTRLRPLPGAAQHSGKQLSALERRAGPKQAAIHPGTHAEELAVGGRAKARTIYLCCQATDSHLRTHLSSWINTLESKTP